MKTINLIGCLSLIFFIYSCSNKNDKPVLDGFFELRLGMTISEMKDIVDIKLLKDTIDGDLPWDREMIAQRGIKDFYLKSYTIDESHIIENIDLSFRHDSLYRIGINKFSPFIEDLLTQKYGKPRTDQYILPGDVETTETEWKTHSTNRNCRSLKFKDYPDNYILMLLSSSHVQQIQKEIKEDEEKGFNQLLDKF